MTRTSRCKIATSLTAAIALLAFGGVAQAAAPFSPGAGFTPNVTVDSTGVGHAVWQIEPADKIGYCRIPKNGTACDLTAELSYPSTTAPEGLEFPSVSTPAGSNVVIVGGCYRIVAGTRSGSTIRLRARAFMKVRRGRSPTKSLRATIKVC